MRTPIKRLAALVATVAVAGAACAGQGGTTAPSASPAQSAAATAVPSTTRNRTKWRPKRAVRDESRLPNSPITK